MLWLALSGVERFIIEILRAKDDRFFGVITVAQVISLAVVAVGVAGVVRLSRPADAAEPAVSPRKG
jgi:phosphatidylglycerol:prolipoprotein diacylglycerol transferase